MRRITSRTIFLVGLLAVSAVTSQRPVLATESWFATVVRAPRNDPLNARTRPTTKAPVIQTFVNGNEVQLTATCINAATQRKLDLNTSQLFVTEIQKRIEAPNMWCEIFGEQRRLWVRGRYLKLSEEG
jgi:uncharacterized protein YraI